jgi:2-dehydropantoate 2-reductase
VVLCTHAGAVRTPWFGPFAEAMGQAVLVNLHPDLEGREAVARHVPRERVIEGMITLVSNRAPLPGETAAEPGIAFWLPPLAKVPFQGPEAVVAPLLEVFRRGGFPVRHDRTEGDSPGGLVADAVLSTFVLALEGVGWKIERFLTREQSRLAKQAILETLAVQYRVRGMRQSLFVPRAILGRIFFRAFIRLCQRLMPFDLETSLRVHFTKVREQGRDGLNATLRHGRELGIATPALQQIAAQVGATL